MDLTLAAYENKRPKDLSHPSRVAFCGDPHACNSLLHANDPVSVFQCTPDHAVSAPAMVLLIDPTGETVTSVGVHIESVFDGGATHDEAADSVPRERHAQAATVKVEVGEIGDAGKRMLGDHQRPLQSLPSFGGLDYYPAEPGRNAPHTEFLLDLGDLRPVRGHDSHVARVERYRFSTSLVDVLRLALQDAQRSLGFEAGKLGVQVSCNLGFAQKGGDHARSLARQTVQRAIRSRRAARPKQQATAAFTIRRREREVVEGFANDFYGVSRESPRDRKLVLRDS
jgi:hypothetical protein